MTSTQKTKKNSPSLFSPWSEFKHYGYFKHDWKWLLLWLTLAIVLSFVVPDGQSKNIFQYLTFHIAMAGFGATVFGFTILGGKDDFFEPIIKEKRDGINTLRDMVLFLFAPLVLHGISCGLLIIYILFPDITQISWLQVIFRCVYGYFAIWAFAQTYFSYRFLFILAITRLVWKYKQVYHSTEVKKEKKENK
jgi:hypothetical protein